MIWCVVGARPNFTKIAPVFLELRRRGLDHSLIHTGQHYDANMSRVFFDELGLPEPDRDLGVGSDTHARQTARIMTALEELCQQRRPDLIVVGGDVNSTLASALVAGKELIPLAHVEAGLRSFDRTMPEEINRIVTDHLSDFLFTTEESGNRNLEREGMLPERVHFVGNCMVDTLLRHVDAAVRAKPWEGFGVGPGQYALLTLHRPSNVDEQETLTHLLGVINEVSRRLPVLFPVHPRTRQHLLQWKAMVAPGLKLLEPLPYLVFLGLMARASFVLTDSGGIQEETTALQVPCLTLRRNTERPITLTAGTNRLVGTDSQKIIQAVEEISGHRWTSGKVPPLWDGKAGERIVDILERWIRKSPTS